MNRFTWNTSIFMFILNILTMYVILENPSTVSNKHPMLGINILLYTSLPSTFNEVVMTTFFSRITTVLKSSIFSYMLIILFLRLLTCLLSQESSLASLLNSLWSISNLYLFFSWHICYSIHPRIPNLISLLLVNRYLTLHSIEASLKLFNIWRSLIQTLLMQSNRFFSSCMILVNLSFLHLRLFFDIFRVLFPTTFTFIHLIRFFDFLRWCWLGWLSSNTLVYV